MKKLLSILLALFIAASAVTAASAVMPGLELEPACNRAAFAPHSLNFELPVVTGLSAEWNGEMLLSPWLEPWFSPENVDVTVTFDDGSSEVLTRWAGQEWSLWLEINHRTGVVTIAYYDANMIDALREGNPYFCCEWCNPVEWAAFLATLQQDSFTFPTDYRETFVNGFRPIAAMRLNETVTTAGEAFFTFTPQTSRQFRLYGSGELYFLAVFDANLDLYFATQLWPGSGSTIWLEAGQTYYVFISLFSWDNEALPEGERGLTITDNFPDWWGSSSSWIDRAVASWWRLGWDLQSTWWGRSLWVVVFPLSIPVSLALLGLQWIVHGRTTHSIF